MRCFVSHRWSASSVDLPRIEIAVSVDGDLIRASEYILEAAGARRAAPAGAGRGAGGRARARAHVINKVYGPC